MQLFLEIYGYLSVVMRGLILAAQTLTLGGAAFLVFAAPAADSAFERSARRLILWSALALAIGEAISGAGLVALLHGTLDLPLTELVGADAVLAAAAGAASAAFLAFLVRADASARLLLICSALLVAAQVAVTHAASRPDNGLALYLAEYAHMLAVGLWIGGIPYFLMTLKRVEGPARRLAAARFSMMSVAAVATLIGSGFYLARDYVGQPAALYGASYGVMLSTKIILLAALLLLGGLNFLTVRRWRAEPLTPILSMRRFAEVEIGVGLTVVFCAASLASLPPAKDLSSYWASGAEVVERLAPRWPPRLESPDLSSLSITQAQETRPSAPLAYAIGEPPAPPRNAADVAWSEYNHHWAGLFVLAMGALALAERRRIFAPAARHWPLVFLGLAAFIFLRADEGAWPLGRIGFFDSLRDPEIAQHKLAMLLIVAFGLFEWRVRLGKFTNGAAPFVFPIVTAVAAAVLLTHSHGFANPKEEMLTEITHTPLALVGVAAGWSRWLELRLDEGRAQRAAALVWPNCFVLAGLLLLFYREA
ncbi:MAG TPA: CopD family protein [Methylocystis sp.]|nr:CopD family protein [Methylocystis sp.]